MLREITGGKWNTLTPMKQVAVSNDCLRQRKFATGVTSTFVMTQTLLS